MRGGYSERTWLLSGQDFPLMAPLESLVAHSGPICGRLYLYAVSPEEIFYLYIFPSLQITCYLIQTFMTACVIAMT